MTKIEVDVAVRCADCGSTLEARSIEWDREIELRVDPCSVCLSEASSEGFSDGKKEVVEGRVKELEGVVDVYAQHLPTCPVYRYGAPGCTCGLSTAKHGGCFRPTAGVRE